MSESTPASDTPNTDADLHAFDKLEKRIQKTSKQTAFSTAKSAVLPDTKEVLVVHAAVAKSQPKHVELQQSTEISHANTTPTGAVTTPAPTTDPIAIASTSMSDVKSPFSFPQMEQLLGRADRGGPSIFATYVDREGNVIRRCLEPYVSIAGGPILWIALAVKVPDRLVRLAFALAKSDLPSHQIVTVPGVTPNREHHHITLLYGIDEKDYPQAARTVQVAKIEMDDLAFSDPIIVQSPTLKLSNTCCITSNVTSAKVDALRARLAKEIPFTNPRGMFPPHVALLFLQGPAPTSVSASGASASVPNTIATGLLPTGDVKVVAANVPI